MKKNYIVLKSALIGCLFGLLSIQSNAQFDQVSDVLKSGKVDANKLLESYLTPIGKAWGYDLAGGWYNTANTHKKFGFDLTLSVNFAQTPEADLIFDILDLGLNKIEPVDATNTIFPTITNGTDVNSIKIEETISTTEQGQTFSSIVTLLPPTELKGFNIPVGIPLPTLNLGFGLPFGIELVGRYIPSTALGDFGNLGLWGIGIKHDFLQWLPIVDRIPFLRASVFAGYSNFDMNVDIPYTVPDVDDPAGYVNPKDQQIDLNVTAFHTAILIGVKLPIINPYVSLGLTSTKFDLNLLGEYALPKPITLYNNNIPTGVGTTLDANDPDYTLHDPILINISSGLKPVAAVGLRIKLAVITLHAQYTIQEYTMITGGIGISFR